MILSVNSASNESFSFSSLCVSTSVRLKEVLCAQSSKVLPSGQCCRARGKRSTLSGSVLFWRDGKEVPRDRDKRDKIIDSNRINGTYDN
jgi:hypothetical protein